MYNIINGTLYFPTGNFVQNYFPYINSHTLNYIRPFARTNYLYSSVVPSVITLWNNLPDSTIKPLLSLYLRLTYFISKYCCLCSHCPFFWRHKFHHKKKMTVTPSNWKYLLYTWHHSIQLGTHKCLVLYRCLHLDRMNFPNTVLK